MLLFNPTFFPIFFFRNPYYGSQWSSHSMSSLLEWIKSASEEENNENVESNDSPSCIKLKNTNIYKNVQYKWCVPESICEDSETESSTNETQSSDVPLLSQESIMKDSRKFNIDLAPKVLYSRGAMVEQLISSNVARYVEFKSINRLLCYLESQDSLVNVPCSREQVSARIARLLFSFGGTN